MLKLTQDDIEEILKAVYYDPGNHKSFNKWVQNFALNLKDIWNEDSAKELTSKHKESYSNKTAIVIGRGPSLKKYKHLEKLANSNFKGSIICTDGALINALTAGITPDRFPDFYVASIDPGEKIKKFYEHDIVDKYGKNISGIFSTTIHPNTISRARDAGIKPYWLHSLVDLEEGEKSFNQISALMTRAKNHVNGLPAIQTGGNVGTSSWFIAWQILKCPIVCLIGINHGWNESDSWDTILTHGNTHKKINIDQSSSAFDNLYPKIYNSFDDSYCVLDPIFQYYSHALKEFIYRSPKWLTTINATQGGSIFGKRIIEMTFAEFLKEYSA